MLEFGPGKPSWKNLVRRFLMHQVPVLKPDNGHVVHAIAAKFPKSQVNAFDRCPHILEVSDDHDYVLDAMATEARDDVTDHKRQSVVATVREGSASRDQHCFGWLRGSERRNAHQVCAP